VNDGLFIIHVERIDANKDEHPAMASTLGEVRGDIAIEVITASSAGSSTETQLIYITKDAADDLVQMLGKHPLAVE
jgi:hypothetical protein